MLSLTEIFESKVEDEIRGESQTLETKLVKFFYDNLPAGVRNNIYYSFRETLEMSKTEYRKLFLEKRQKEKIEKLFNLLN
jgi:hypothetical protein